MLQKWEITSNVFFTTSSPHLICCWFSKKYMECKVYADLLGFETPPVSSIAHKHILPYHPYCMVYIYLHELVDFYGICFLVRSIIPIPWIFMASHATWLQLRSCTLQQWDLQEVDAILLHPESGSSTRKRRFREKKTWGVWLEFSLPLKN